MAIFKIQHNKVKKLYKNKNIKEYDIQKLIEKNLEEILGITFLDSEYSTTWGGRIDTLGIDKNGSPVIIEYKLRENENVINQGLSYLRWLLDHKADFEKLCKNNNIKVEISWSSPRVICIAESFNKFDLDTVDVVPIRIELLRYTIYEDDILQIEIQEDYKEVMKESQKRKTKKEDEKLVKYTSINDHLSGKDQKIKELFYTLREKIMSLDNNIIEEPKLKYIAYKLVSNFTDIVVLRNSLKIFLNVKSGELKDPWGIARDLTKPKFIGHWGNGDYEVKLDSLDGVDKVFELIKQSYEKNN